MTASATSRSTTWEPKRFVGGKLNVAYDCATSIAFQRVRAARLPRPVTGVRTCWPGWWCVVRPVVGWMCIGCMVVKRDLGEFQRFAVLWVLGGSAPPIAFALLTRTINVS